MSSFEGTTSSDVVLPTDTTAPTTATTVQETPSTVEAEAAAEAIMSAQPTGDSPSAAEIEGRTMDERDAQSSMENLLPREKLENGFRNVSCLFPTANLERMFHRYCAVRVVSYRIRAAFALHQVHCPFPALHPPHLNSPRPLHTPECVAFKANHKIQNKHGGCLMLHLCFFPEGRFNLCTSTM